MTEFTAKLLRGGMITVPIEVRLPTDMKVGDYLRLDLREVIRGPVARP